MNERSQDSRSVATGGTSTDAPDAGQKDHFLQLMFFQAHHPDWLVPFYAGCFFLAALCWLGVNADQPLVAHSDD